MSGDICISVDMVIDQIDTEDLVRELRHRDHGDSIDPHLRIAREELVNGRVSEAVIHLERYLGREWIGVLSGRVV